jgi:hypothetical protein
MGPISLAELTLPSGRVIETHEPLFGEFIHIASTAGESIEGLVYAKFAVIVPGMTREEIEGLNRDDGFALLNEVGRIWDGRSEEDSLPLSNGGQPSSMATSPHPT